MTNNRILLLLTLILLSVIAGGCGYVTGQAVEWNFRALAKAPFAKDISVTGAYAAFTLNFGQYDFTVIDVRTAEEYAAGHIPGALNRDYLSPAFKNDINDFKKDRIYLVYCGTGMRSAAASRVMAELGFKYIYNMTGGYTDWVAAGLPVVQ